MTIPAPAALAQVPLFAGVSAADLEKLSHWFEVETCTHFREMQMGMPQVAARIEALVKERSAHE